MGALRRRWWLIVALGILVALIVGIRDSGKTKQYTATTTLLFGSNGTNAASLLNAQSVSSAEADPDREQATTVLLITSSSVSDLVRRALHFKGDPASHVVASAEPDANLIDITATDPDPAMAARLANTFAAEYQSFIKASNVAGLRRGVAKLQAQLAATPPTDPTQIAALETSITSLQQQVATASSGVAVVDRATPPTSPSSPKTKRDVLIALLLGLALGVAIVLLLNSFDRRLRSLEDVEHEYGRPSRAIIPQQRGTPSVGATTGDDDGDPLNAEPFRILRTVLSHLGTDVSRVVLVTSATAGEGKSLTAVGLARAWASTGRPVALVELDLRRPALHRHFRLTERDGGMVDALRGRVAVDRVGEHPVEELPSLTVFPAGGTPARSAELLGDARVKDTLRALAADHDVVIIDAPPLLPVADTQELLECDAVDILVLVGRVDVVTRDQAQRAHQIVDAHGWTDYLLVVNGAPPRATQQQYGGGYAPLTPTPEPADSDALAAAVSDDEPDGSTAVATKTRPPRTNQRRPNRGSQRRRRPPSSSS